MKILACGDTHGDTSSICNVAIPQAMKRDCKIIMQVGDFGYWEHMAQGKKFLDKISRHLVNSEVTMYWIDGNHDNHPKLWAEYSPSGEFGFVRVRPNLYYVPRGTVWKWNDITFLGIGGAYSIDKDWRLGEELTLAGHGCSYGRDPYTKEDIRRAVEMLDHTLWWPTEMIRPEDVSVAVGNVLTKGPIDVMFAHDAPVGVDVPGIHAEDKWRFPETWTNRENLRKVFDAALPQLLVHGHYHTRYTGGIHWQNVEGEPLDGCRVEGLACNGMSGFAIVLDLEALFGDNMQ